MNAYFIGYSEGKPQLFGYTGPDSLEKIIRDSGYDAVSIPYATQKEAQEVLESLKIYSHY